MFAHWKSTKRLQRIIYLLFERTFEEVEIQPNVIQKTLAANVLHTREDLL